MIFFKRDALLFWNWLGVPKAFREVEGIERTQSIFLFCFFLFVLMISYFSKDLLPSIPPSFRKALFGCLLWSWDQSVELTNLVIIELLVPEIGRLCSLHMLWSLPFGIFDKTYCLRIILVPILSAFYNLNYSNNYFGGLLSRPPPDGFPGFLLGQPPLPCLFFHLYSLN